MMRRVLSLTFTVLACFALSIARADNLEFDADDGDEISVDVSHHNATSTSRGFDITFTSNAPHHLFQYGQPVEMTIHIANTRKTQSADISTYVSTALGSIVYAKTDTQVIPVDGAVDESISLATTEPLPRGSYLVEVLVKGEEDLAFNSTRLSIWDGPTAAQSDLFGISYLGPLDTPQTLADLDLFRQAGIGWLRFPLHGWLPQGDTVPADAPIYDAFVREASNRNINLLAAFTPQVTIDPSVNAAQAEKEYHESLLAAATRYGFKIKNWELLTVKPADYPPGLRGIGYSVINPGREALRRLDKSLQVTFPLENPLQASMMELLFYKLPAKGDTIGIHYDFLGIPEYEKAAPAPPTFSASALQQQAKTALKRIPPLQATEYGIDPQKTNKLLPAPYQAAIISRAFMLNTMSGIGRTFWRHQPGNLYTLPFTNADGSVQPSLLAIRTTLQALNGVSSVAPITTSLDRIHACALQTVVNKKKRITHTVIAIWSEGDASRMGIALKSSAAEIAVTDLWGNATKLRPYQDTVLLQVDEFPRFIDVGTAGQFEFRDAGRAIGFAEKIMKLAPNGEQKAIFRLNNSQYLFEGPLTGECRFHAWPVSSQVAAQSFTLAPFTSTSFALPISIPADARNGKQLCEVGVDIYVGDRQIGYLTMPVNYSSTSRNGEEVETE